MIRRSVLSSKTVPLVIYDGNGVVYKIGTATVTVDDRIGWCVSATVTDAEALDLGFDKGPFSIGAQMPDREVQEVAIAPPWFVEKKETNAQDQTRTCRWYRRPIVFVSNPCGEYCRLEEA
jgi:hypothetical protein